MTPQAAGRGAQDLIVGSSPMALDCPGSTHSSRLLHGNTVVFELPGLRRGAVRGLPSHRRALPRPLCSPRAGAGAAWGTLAITASALLGGLSLCPWGCSRWRLERFASPQIPLQARWLSLFFPCLHQEVESQAPDSFCSDDVNKLQRKSSQTFPCFFCSPN